MEHSQRNLDSIQTLILDMFRFSKDETFNLQPCHLNRLVPSAAETIRPQADPRQVKLTLELNEKLESISMDPHKRKAGETFTAWMPIDTSG
jgi:signal transduction histidine kinase